MSAPTSSEEHRWAERRWHKARLAVAIAGAPILALGMQALAYADVPWACVTGNRGALHLIAAVFVALCIAVVADAVLLLSRGGRRSLDGPAPLDRTRFVAITGLMLSSASLLLILGMWIPLFVFDPCVR